MAIHCCAFGSQRQPSFSMTSGVVSAAAVSSFLPLPPPGAPPAATVPHTVTSTATALPAVITLVRRNFPPFCLLVIVAFGLLVLGLLLVFRSACGGAGWDRGLRS
jgi:hypothetical protein